MTNYFGKENAILCGLDLSIGNYVIIMDPDLEDPPSLIPKVNNQNKMGYDVVYAKRINQNNNFGMINFLKKLYYFIFAKFAEPNLKIYENTGDFKILSRNAVNNLKEIREITRFNRSLTSYIESNKPHVNFKRPSRVKGKSKSNFKFLWNYSFKFYNFIVIKTFRNLVLFWINLVYFFYFICTVYFLSKNIRSVTNKK